MPPTIWATSGLAPLATSSRYAVVPRRRCLSWMARIQMLQFAPDLESFRLSEVSLPTQHIAASETVAAERWLQELRGHWRARPARHRLMSVLIHRHAASVHASSATIAHPHAVALHFRRNARPCFIRIVLKRDRGTCRQSTIVWHFSWIAWQSTWRRRRSSAGRPGWLRLRDRARCQHSQSRR